MSTTQISLDVVRETLAKIVNERPDYVYPRNAVNDYSYTESDGAPSCVVGHVFAALTPDLLKDIHDNLEWTADEEYPEFQTSAPINTLRYEFPEITNLFGLTALRYLRNAQVVQDTGSRWETALDKAEAYLIDLAR